MFRIALIIAALTSGHHHITVTQPNGAGYMTTATPCVRYRHTLRPQHGLIVCVQDADRVVGHLDVKARFDVHATASLNGHVIHTRRAYIYNAHGRVAGWVDWTPGARAVGRVILRDGFGEEWQR